MSVNTTNLWNFISFLVKINIDHNYAECPVTFCNLCVRLCNIIGFNMLLRCLNITWYYYPFRLILTPHLVKGRGRYTWTTCSARERRPLCLSVRITAGAIITVNITKTQACRAIIIQVTKFQSYMKVLKSITTLPEGQENFICISMICNL